MDSMRYISKYSGADIDNILDQVAGKVQKVTDTNIVYGTDESGNQGVYKISELPICDAQKTINAAQAQTNTAVATAITALNTSKQDVLTAGTNISIVNNVISATGGIGTKYETFTVSNWILENGKYVYTTTNAGIATNIFQLNTDGKYEKVSNVGIRESNGHIILVSDFAFDGKVNMLAGNVTYASTTLAGYGITDAYTKTEINTELDSIHQDINDRYTKEEVDNGFDAKLDKYQTAANAGKLLIINKSGNIEPFATGDVVSVHNAIWGGRDLVAEFGSIANIITAVQAGDFSNIFVGDYIPVTPFDAGYGTSDNKAYVAEIKGYENMGDTRISANHLVMTMSCGSRKMNDTNTTTGGYLGTKVHTEAMPAIQTKLEQIFGASHILTPRVYLTNTVNDSTPSMAGCGTNGAATNTAWTSVKCWLPNEINVYGSLILSSSLRDCMGYPKHLAIYRHKEHVRLWGRSDFWLSCVFGYGRFCFARNNGAADGYGASTYPFSLRPLFLLG